MSVLCPRHNIELTIQETVIDFYGIKHVAVVGSCPHCKVKYINRNLFPGASFSCGGVQYEYSLDMFANYRLDAQTESAIREKEAKKIQQEKQEQERRENYLNLKNSLEKNPRMTFRPAFREYVSEYPEHCPHDDTPIIYVGNIGKNMGGYCCLYCSRLFVVKDNGVEKKQLDNSKKKHTKSIQNKPKSITANNKTTTDRLAKTWIKFFDSSTPPPKETILIASLYCSKQKIKGCIAIVTDSKCQKTAQGVYWIGRPFSQMILNAIQSGINRPEFAYNGVVYTVESYKIFPKAKAYIDAYKAFCNPTAPQTVHIFAGKHISEYENDRYACVTAMIPCANSLLPISTTVYYDKKAQLYYMNDISYSELCKKYGLPYLRVRIDTGNCLSSDFASLKSESPLHLMGYNVNSSEGMSDSERHAKLSQIIDSGLLSKAEVLSHLEWLINANAGKSMMYNAVEKWSSDRKFVASYKMDKSRSVFITAFESKYSGKISIV